MSISIADADLLGPTSYQIQIEGEITFFSDFLWLDGPAGLKPYFEFFIDSTLQDGDVKVRLTLTGASGRYHAPLLHFVFCFQASPPRTHWAHIPGLGFNPQAHSYSMEWHIIPEVCTGFDSVRNQALDVLNRLDALMNLKLERGYQ